MAPIAVCADPSTGAAQSTDSAALAKKLKAEERELEQQRHDIDALRNELRSLVATAHKAQTTEAQAKATPSRKGSAPQVAARPVPANTASPQSPLTFAAAPQTHDQEAVGDQVQQLQSALLETRAGQMQTADASQMPNQPVGQQPEAPKKLPDAAALPEDANLLTPTGNFIFTPSIEYTRSSANLLVFRGVEIVPGLQLGLINASSVAQDYATTTADLRYGILDRLELELRVPFVDAGDRETQLSQQVVSGTQPATITSDLNGNNLGDIEGSLRYQLNGDVKQDDPVYILSLRVKSNTGVSPYDVKFDGSGVAQSLATGTGFWGVGPGFLVLVPSDPAVLYVNGAYLHSFGYDVGKTIGTTPVGNVSPGDSLQLGLGFGLAVNSKFSFSLGYLHTTILPTTQDIGTTKQVSTTLQSGQLSLGASYAISPNYVINTQFEFGVTSDAPNLDVTFRIPMNL